MIKIRNRARHNTRYRNWDLSAAKAKNTMWNNWLKIFLTSTAPNLSSMWEESWKWYQSVIYVKIPSSNKIYSISFLSPSTNVQSMNPIRSSTIPNARTQRLKSSTLMKLSYVRSVTLAWLIQGMLLETRNAVASYILAVCTSHLKIMANLMLT